MQGNLNFVLLAGILGAVLISGLWKPDLEITILGTARELQIVLRDLALLGIAWVSGG